MGAPDCIHRQPFLPSGAACQLDRASSLYRDGDHSVNILVAPEQILKQYEKPSPGHISGLNIVKHT